MIRISQRPESFYMKWVRALVRSIVWSIDWLADWLMVRLIDWLVDWLRIFLKFVPLVFRWRCCNPIMGEILVGRAQRLRMGWNALVISGNVVDAGVSADSSVQTVVSLPASVPPHGILLRETDSGARNQSYTRPPCGIVRGRLRGHPVAGPEGQRVDQWSLHAPQLGFEPRIQYVYDSISDNTYPYSISCNI